MGRERYLLDDKSPEAGRRLEALSAIFNPWTFRHLDSLGIAAGWRCWEVGAGGLSVPRWLAGRVGPTGRVLATDIDLSWAEQAEGPPLTVRRHDVGRDEPPAETFDLVHARLVLVHVPDRDKALRSMAGVVRPGGWLIVEDADPGLQPLSCPDVRGPDQQLANKVRAGFRALLSQRGADLEYGRKLPRLLRGAGLVDVAADGYFPVSLPECAALEAATVRMVRKGLVEQGRASTEEIDRHLANVIQGRLDLAQPPMISAWGRRPPDLPAGAIRADVG